MPQHRLRCNETTEAASLWLFFDTESLPSEPAGPQQKVVHNLRLGEALFVRLAGADVIQRTWCHFTTPAEFWSFVESHLSAHRPLWAVAHNTSFDWPLVGGYDYLLSHKDADWKLIFGPPVTILTGKPRGKKLVVLDGLNYFRASISEIGDWQENCKLPMPEWSAPDEAWRIYCRQDVRILADAVLRLVALHRSENLGVFGKTLGQCAVHSYRHRLCPKITRPTPADSRARARGKLTESATRLTLHGDDDLCKHERQCYYGGRAECRRIGTFKGPWYDLDCNSLYAAIMADTPLPCCWRDIVEDVPLDWLEARLGLYEVAAEVRIDSDMNTYPYRVTAERVSDRLGSLPLWVEEYTRRSTAPIYVLGRFWTYLCGTELRHALQRGHVIECRRAAVYERTHLFREYVDYWYGRRIEGYRTGDKWTERVAKSYLTALAGVWAKHGARWLSTDDWTPAEDWGKVYCWDAIEEVRHTYRALAGVAQEQVEDGEPFDVLPIISASIAAEGRERLRAYQAIAGLDHWLYEDTDSLLVDQTGYDRLVAAGLVDELRLGALRCRSIVETATIYGVKDYVLDGRRVCKGIRNDADWRKEPEVTQQRWTGHRAQLDSRATVNPTVKLETLHLRRRYSKGEVDSAGWVQPWVLGRAMAPF